MGLDELDRFMAAIRTTESSNNYSAEGPSTRYGTATGAYQFLDSTWDGHGGYGRAFDAPPDVQDARARELMTNYFNQFGRWDLVAVAWHAGPGRAREAASNPAILSQLSDGLSTTEQYAAKVTRLMGSADLNLAPGVWSPSSDPGGAPDERLRTFLEAALAQRGDEYDWGVDLHGDEVDPDRFDCAELVQWSAAQAGVSMGEASDLQYLDMRGAGATVSVQEALATPGALLFRFSSEPGSGGRPADRHVAISLGDGRVMEARGRDYGVNIFDATGRTWTHGAVIPEFSGAELPEPPPTEPLEYGQDSDEDGLLDWYEHFIGTDPFDADTDRDGFLDLEEVLTFDTDPLDFADNYLVQLTGDVPQYRPPLTNAVAGSDGGTLVDDLLGSSRRPPPSYTPPPTDATTSPTDAAPVTVDPGAGADTEDGPDTAETDPDPDPIVGPEDMNLDDPVFGSIASDWAELDTPMQDRLSALGFDETRWASFHDAHAGMGVESWFDTNRGDLQVTSIDELNNGLFDLFDGT